MGSRKAFGLLETILSAVLMLLLLTLLFQVLVPMLRASRRGSEMSDLRQSAALALETLTREVEQTASSGLEQDIGPAPDVPRSFSVHSIVDQLPSGKSLWAANVHVYGWLRSSRRLVRRDCPPGLALPSSSRPYHWATPNLRQFWNSANSTQRLVCPDVEDFEIEGLSNQGARLPLIFRLHLKRPGLGPKGSEEFRLEARAQPHVRLNR